MVEHVAKNAALQHAIADRNALVAKDDEKRLGLSRRAAEEVIDKIHQQVTGGLVKTAPKARAPLDTLRTTAEHASPFSVVRAEAEPRPTEPWRYAPVTLLLLLVTGGIVLAIVFTTRSTSASSSAVPSSKRGADEVPAAVGLSTSTTTASASLPATTDVPPPTTARPLDVTPSHPHPAATSPAPTASASTQRPPPSTTSSTAVGQFDPENP